LERGCEVFPVLGEASIAAEPGEGSLDDPTARQHDEAFHGVAAFDDFEAKRRNLGHRRVDLMGVVSAVRPNELEPGKAVADFVEHQRRPIAVLDASRMNDDAQRQTFGVDQGVNFAALDLLAGVIAGQAVMTAPFSELFSDWLSTIAAVGDASRSISSRKSMCNLCQIASQTPSFWKLRKML